jgi:2'-5' RNA ligase
MGGAMTKLTPGDGFLGIVLPDGAAQEVLHWRRMVPGILENMGPPHITMFYPPFVPRESWSRAAPALAECIGGFAPFEVVLRETGTFPGDPSYLWLKPEDAGMLKRMRDVLAERFPHYVSVAAFDGSFVPHVTVSVFDRAQALAQARKRIANGMAPIHFWVTEFMYGAFDQDGGVVYIDRLSLGEGSAVPGCGPA